MSYENLSDEDKITEAIRFVATGQPLPEVLTDFLNEAGLYDAIVIVNEEPCQIITSAA